jgi:hypothetical protein
MLTVLVSQTMSLSSSWVQFVIAAVGHNLSDELDYM